MVIDARSGWPSRGCKRNNVGDRRHWRQVRGVSPLQIQSETLKPPKGCRAIAEVFKVRHRHVDVGGDTLLAVLMLVHVAVIFAEMVLHFFIWKMKTVALNPGSVPSMPTVPALSHQTSSASFARFWRGRIQCSRQPSCPELHDQRRSPLRSAPCSYPGCRDRRPARRMTDRTCSGAQLSCEASSFARPS